MKKRIMALLMTVVLIVTVLIGCAAAAAEADSQSIAQVTEAPAGKVQMMTSEAAVAVALNHAGLTAGEVAELKAELGENDGAMEYDIEFRSGDYEYDYTINAESGKLIAREKEHDPIETAPAAEKPPATEPAAEKISAAKAKSVALNHAGLSSDEVRGLEYEYDVDDGVKKYEVSFSSGKYEYEYEINAETGKIISHDREKDD